jgi:hypothetical protein
MYKFLVFVLVAALLFFSVARSDEVAGISNRVKWVTASEVNNFGFDVFRGDSEDGPFVRINESTIPGAGNSDIPNQYEFVDETIEAGKVYWYYVESISMSDQREKFTPTFKSKPRFPAADP